jgi:putative ABC transport system permease protein
MDELLRDIQYALRSMRRAPGITVVATVTLAIGIASVSTVFSFVNSVYYRPLPYPDADRIVALSTVTERGYADWSQQPLPVVELLRHEAHSFERIAALDESASTLTGGDKPVLISRTAVDTSVLGLIGAKAERGRLLSRTDIVERAHVALISDSLWRANYGAREDIVGQLLHLDGVTFEVVGVLQPGLRFYERSDVLVPLVEHADSVRAGDGQMFVVFGKLRPGVTVAQARVEVERLAERLKAADPQFTHWKLIVQNRMIFRARLVGPATRAWMFVGVAICLLLIACTNVANLLLVRAAERRSEAAIRIALGGSRARLIRRSLTESLLIGLGAGALGLLLAVWIVKVLTSVLPLYGVPSWMHFGLDVRVLAFTVLITLVAVTVCGAAPALEATRVNLQGLLKAGGHSVVISHDVMRSARRGIVLETAISVMLFIGAALLWKSYIKLASLDVGFDASRVVRVSVAPDRFRYSNDSLRATFNRNLAERIAADHRVAAVSLRTSGAMLATDAAVRERQDKARPAGEKPLSYDDAVGIFLPAEPTRSVDHDLRPQVLRYGVSDSYFRVLGLPILLGRGFDPSDREASPPVAVVSEQLARRAWRRDNVVGETFRIGKIGTPITVIGIAHDVLQPISTEGEMRAEPMSTVYLSDRQSTLYDATTLVRAKGNPEFLSASIATFIRRYDATASVSRVETLAAEAEHTAMVSKLAGIVIGALALCGLLLAIVGVYGVIAYGITQRTREIGLRLAIGGTPKQLIGLFIRDGMRMIVGGLAIGLVLALAASRLLRFFLLGVSPFDPFSYGGVLALFGMVALLACWLPARRATRVDPSVALRAE